MSDLLRVAVWRPEGDHYRWVTDIGEPLEGTKVAPRYNAAGLWTLNAPWDTQAQKIRESHLITFDFRDSRVTGILTSFGAEGAAATGERFRAESNLEAWALLDMTDCWPDPQSAVDEQNVISYRREAETETIVKNLIRANMVDRLGYAIHIPPSQGRGRVTKVNLAFKNLGEVVARKLNRAGLGATLGLVDMDSVTARLVFDIFEPQDRTGPGAAALSPPNVPGGTGTVRRWSYNKTAPTMTRTTVQASKEETTLTIGNVNVALNRLTIEGKDNARHRLRTGDIIRFSGRGTPPTPLQDHRAYFAIRVDNNTFSVATTRTRALAGQEIDLTDAGEGAIKFTETTIKREHVVRAFPESVWNRKPEGFVTTSLEDDEDESVYTERGEEALDEAVAQSSFELEASESVGFRYATHYNLGDVLPVLLPGGVSESDRLRSVEIALTKEGVTVDLTVGNPDAKPLFRHAQIVRGLRQDAAEAKREET